MENGARDAKRRYFMLDVIRIVCALCIFGRHAQTMAGFSFGRFNDLFLNSTSMIMTTFFVVSGFSLYLSNSGKDILAAEHLSGFFKKRAVSILPVYYLVHFLWLFFYEEDPVQGLLYTPVELLGLQSVFSMVFGVMHNGGTWFISCVIICYCVYPYIQELIGRLGRKVRLLALGGVVLLLLYLPFYAIQTGSMSLYTNPFLRLIEFSLGVVLASVAMESKQGKAYVVIPIVLASVAALFLIYYNSITQGEASAIILVCIVIFCSVQIECAPLDHSRLLKYCSTLTYHFFIFQLLIWVPSLKLIKYMGVGAWKYDFIIPLLLLTVICVCVHELYEKPLQKWLRKKLGI